MATVGSRSVKVATSLKADAEQSLCELDYQPIGDYG